MQFRIVSNSFIAALTLAGTLAGCGDSTSQTNSGTDSGPGDDTGDTPPVWPGYVVECNPDVSGHQLVCMTDEDYDCSVRDHYVRESICADL